MKLVAIHRINVVSTFDLLSKFKISNASGNAWYQNNCDVDTYKLQLDRLSSNSNSVPNAHSKTICQGAIRPK